MKLISLRERENLWEFDRKKSRKVGAAPGGRFGGAIRSSSQSLASCTYSLGRGVCFGG